MDKMTRSLHCTCHLSFQLNLLHALMRRELPKEWHIRQILRQVLLQMEGRLLSLFLLGLPCSCFLHPQSKKNCQRTEFQRGWVPFRVLKASLHVNTSHCVSSNSYYLVNSCFHSFPVFSIQFLVFVITSRNVDLNEVEYKRL